MVSRNYVRWTEEEYEQVASVFASLFERNTPKTFEDLQGLLNASQSILPTNRQRKMELRSHCYTVRDQLLEIATRAGRDLTPLDVLNLQIAETTLAAKVEKKAEQIAALPALAGSLATRAKIIAKATPVVNAPVAAPAAAPVAAPVATPAPQVARSNGLVKIESGVESPAPATKTPLSAILRQVLQEEMIGQISNEVVDRIEHLMIEREDRIMNYLNREIAGLNNSMKAMLAYWESGSIPSVTVTSEPMMANPIQPIGESQVRTEAKPKATRKMLVYGLLPSQRGTVQKDFPDFEVTTSKEPRDLDHVSKYDKVVIVSKFCSDSDITKAKRMGVGLASIMPRDATNVKSWVKN